MRIDIITLFPEMCETVMGESIIGRARKKGAIDVECHQLRDYAFDKHKRVDDTTYGGGMGMLLMAEPIALCFEDICKKTESRPHLIYMSPQGETLTQKSWLSFRSMRIYVYFADIMKVLTREFSMNMLMNRFLLEIMFLLAVSFLH